MFEASVTLFDIIMCSLFFHSPYCWCSLNVDDDDDDDVLTDFDCCVLDFEDINECDTGNNTCTTAQVCFNFQGGNTCLDALQCHSPYIEVSDKWVLPPLRARCLSAAKGRASCLNLSPCVLCSQCMCSAENPACRDKPFTILYRHMDLSSGRSVPADIFQMQATTRYPGAFYIFQIKSGNEGREFYMRVSTSETPPLSPEVGLVLEISPEPPVLKSIALIIHKQRNAFLKVLGSRIDKSPGFWSNTRIIFVFIVFPRKSYKHKSTVCSQRLSSSKE